MVGVAGADDVPVVVVEEHVVSSAEEDSVGDVGFAGVALPGVDVVGFAPGWWAVAVGEAASAVPNCESDALSFGE